MKTVKHQVTNRTNNIKIENMPEKKIIPPIDLQEQTASIRQEIDEAISRVIDTGNFILGDEVALFESDCAEHIGSKHAIGLNSGTDALVIALRALGVGEGDEVVTSPFTFFATAEAICLVGATPVFADIEESSFNIDVCQVQDLINKKTKAIMPVHLYGRIAGSEDGKPDMSNLKEVASGIPIIEDACQAFGAGSPRAGALGDIGCFSFYPTKNLSAFGDGGLLTTDDESIAIKSRMLRQHGEKSRYNNELLGYNSRLDAIQAAILRVKLKHIDKWNMQRREAAERYDSLLNGCNQVIAPEITCGHIFHQYTIRIPNLDRDKVKEKMYEKGVISMVYYPIPANKLPVFGDRFPDCPVSERLSKEVLSLPIWPEIKPEQQKQVVEALLQSISEIAQ